MCDAAAQSFEPTDRPAERSARRKRPGRYKVGPLYLTPRLELRNAGVDTNVYAQGAGMIPDNVIILRPSLVGALPVGRRLRLTGDGHLDLNYFRRSTSERSTDFGGQGRAELDINRFTFFAAGGGLQTRQREWIDIDRRILRQEKWGGAGVLFHLTRRISLTVSGRAQLYRYGHDVINGSRASDSLDRDERTASAGLKYALTRRTSFLARRDLVEHRFLQPVGGGSRIARSYRTLAGFEFGERALFVGRLLVGYREFPDSSAKGLPAYRGPAVSAALVLPFPLVRRLNLTAERDVRIGVAPVPKGEARLRNTYVSTSFAAGAEIALPFDIIGRGRAALDGAKYVLPYPLGGGYQRRVDRVWSLDGSLLRAVTRSLRIGVTTGWTRRVSNFPGQSFEGLRYGLQAEIAP